MKATMQWRFFGNERIFMKLPMGLSNIPSFTHIFSPQFWVSKQEATTHFLNTYLNEYSKCKIPELVLQIIFTAAALNLNEQTRGLPHIFERLPEKNIHAKPPKRYFQKYNYGRWTQSQ